MNVQMVSSAPGRNPKRRRRRENDDHDESGSMRDGTAEIGATGGARHARGRHGGAHRRGGRDAAVPGGGPGREGARRCVRRRHLGAFVLFGLAGSGFFAPAKREKRMLALMFMLGCCLAVVFVAMVSRLSQRVRDAMTPWVFLTGHVSGGGRAVATPGRVGGAPRGSPPG
jgi:hypothetical protein